MKDLTTFFDPRTIAVLGASRDETKLGTQLIKNLLDNNFKGRIYPINPNADFIHKLKCYPDINSIYEVPQLVIISLPSQLVYDNLKKSIDTGCSNFIIITAGFREIGEDGLKEELRIKELISSYKREINILGPNCLGYLNTKHKVNASFAANFPIKGRAKFISQSGALCTAVLDWSQTTKVGFSDFISLGNKMDLNENDLLEYWYSEQENNSEFIYSPIFAYLESFSDGRKFMQIAKKVTMRNPLIVLKPGKFNETRTAMSSHTGSLASDDKVTDQALAQCGVTRIEGLHDLYDLMMAFDWSRLPKGKNVAIVSNAGGPGIITTDFIKQYGLDIAHFSDATMKHLSEKLPRTANIHDPVDVVGDALADRYGFALDIILSEPGVDSVIVLLTPQAMTQIKLTAEYIARLSKTHDKTVVASFMGGQKVAEASDVLATAKIPYFAYPERAVYALSKMYEYNSYKMSAENAKPYSHDLQSGISIPSKFSGPLLNQLTVKSKINKQEYLFGDDAEKLLSIYSVPFAKSLICNNPQDAISFYKGDKAPIALKLSSPYLVHKSDSGAVKLGLDTDEKISNAFDELNALGEGIENMAEEKFRIQAQKMSNIKYELIIGTKRDPNFGPIILFGMGGIYTEIYNDTSLMILPIVYEDALNMINKTKISQILNGARGGKKEDLSMLAKIISSLSLFMTDNECVKEVDLNPVVFTKDGHVLCLDAKIKI